MAKYVLGLDFGTDSVRTVVVNAESGKEEANKVAYYKRWSQGLYCDPAKNQFRQHPLDYIEGLEEAGLRDTVKIMVGGAPVTTAFAEQIGADAYAPDAATAVDVARNLVA